jgi:hypothetical protein
MPTLLLTSKPQSCPRSSEKSHWAKPLDSTSVLSFHSPKTGIPDISFKNPTLFKPGLLFFSLLVLGFALRASHLLLRHPPTWATLSPPFFLYWVFVRQGLANYLLWLALNCDPSDLCLPSSKPKIKWQHLPPQSSLGSKSLREQRHQKGALVFPLCPSPCLSSRTTCYALFHPTFMPFLHFLLTTRSRLSHGPCGEGNSTKCRKTLGLESWLLYLINV